MGELYGCVLAYAGFNDDIDENPQKIKYYADKLCKGGVSEACGKWYKEEKEIKSLNLRIVCAIFLCFFVMIEDYLNLYPNFLGIYAKIWLLTIKFYHQKNTFALKQPRRQRSLTMTAWDKFATQIYLNFSQVEI